MLIPKLQDRKTMPQSFSTNDQTRIIKSKLQWLPTGRRQHRETDGMHSQNAHFRTTDTITPTSKCYVAHTRNKRFICKIYSLIWKNYNKMLIRTSTHPRYTLTRLILLKFNREETGNRMVPHLVWTTIQNQSTEPRKPVQKKQRKRRWYTGKRWEVKLITTTCKTVLITCETRCELVHRRKIVTQQIHAKQKKESQHGTTFNRKSLQTRSTCSTLLRQKQYKKINNKLNHGYTCSRHSSVKSKKSNKTKETTNLSSKPMKNNKSPISSHQNCNSAPKTV